MVYKLVLVFGDCKHGAIVTASPISGIEVNREVLAHDGTIAALAVTPVRDTVITAWRDGSLIGTAVLTAAGSVDTTG